jgi:hypothetical protein
MPMPEFNEIKTPAIQFFADGKPLKVSEIYDGLTVSENTDRVVKYVARTNSA